MLDYTTKAIDKKLNELKESFNGEEIDTIDVYELLRKEENYINKYHDLMMIYAGYAAGFLLVYNDTYRYKGYCYLAALYSLKIVKGRKRFCLTISRK